MGSDLRDEKLSTVSLLRFHYLLLQETKKSSLQKKLENYLEVPLRYLVSFVLRPQLADCCRFTSSLFSYTFNLGRTKSGAKRFKGIVCDISRRSVIVNDMRVGE
jgi:hypothetical protein